MNKQMLYSEIQKVTILHNGSDAVLLKDLTAILEYYFTRDQLDAAEEQKAIIANAEEFKKEALRDLSIQTMKGLLAANNHWHGQPILLDQSCSIAKAMFDQWQKEGWL